MIGNDRVDQYRNFLDHGRENIGGLDRDKRSRECGFDTAVIHNPMRPACLLDYYFMDDEELLKGDPIQRASPSSVFR